MESYLKFEEETCKLFLPKLQNYTQMILQIFPLLRIQYSREWMKNGENWDKWGFIPILGTWMSIKQTLGYLSEHGLSNLCLLSDTCYLNTCHIRDPSIS